MPFSSPAREASAARALGGAPVTGSATYSFSGAGTGSTSQAGVVGSGVTAGTLTANFASNTVNGQMTIIHGGTFNASGVATLNSPNRAGFNSVSGSTSGA